MFTHSNTPLRASQRKELQRIKLRRQARLRSTMLLAIIVVTWLVDATLIKSDLLVTKGATCGALINWAAQSVFAWFVFRYTGAQAKHSIVGQLYLGQITKWIVTLAGFALVFYAASPLSVGAVIYGFVLMQLAHFISLWRIR
ncbi:ATP synthase subunit I [Psychrobacter sp. FDAARGOS_221]|uniref:ATP synthase subunit I n=1 Tax=Psychrobacter sp. FDAARGOS_221 TaxID=1975705 RepID=UPI000BB546EA|nr:ATP synthase subunit I [Psychrobacter sp. FDAARGOS_221]PNK60550.1 ATP synthase subunit I [Psychrobacter sp. FDAARGOS_221]